MSSLRLQSKEGFTLIEVMIALVILSVGLLALATMQIVSIRANAFSTEMTYASMLAQSEFEEFRNMAYDDITPTGGTPDSKVIPASETSKGIPYTVQWTVKDDNPTTDMKTIELNVLWTGAPAGSATGATVDFKAGFTTVISR
jgi:type IV pilus modification protein PilV